MIVIPFQTVERLAASVIVRGSFVGRKQVRRQHLLGRSEKADVRVEVKMRVTNPSVRRKIMNGTLTCFVWNGDELVLSDKP